MNNNSYILHTPLPVNQDFRLLKEQALAFIQEYSGNAWTNLNPSDAGVTILDQFCYALTELGYCNDFPVGDILAAPGNKLETCDNFYLPGQILTTSPVTIKDYRKYIIHAVDGIDNAVIISAGQKVTNCYIVYLLISDLIKNKKQIGSICVSARFELNKCRNLNEFFYCVLPLYPVSFLVKGEIVFDNENESGKMLAQLQQVIRNFIFPVVNRETANGTGSNTIPAQDAFTGPRLAKGEITETALGQKKNVLNTLEFINLLESVPGVKTVAIEGFCKTFLSPVSDQCTTAKPGEMISVDLLRSIDENLLQVGDKQAVDEIKGLSVSSTNSTGFQNYLQTVVVQNTEPVLPVVTYRDINKYYSIQNTFPEIFAVGADTVIANATDFQMARSRQLKGYLTLFDQVLANQFSQLANLGRLFSFKNLLTTSPAAAEDFYAVKDKFEKQHPGYPAPYMAFSPTYFCQPLYDVPHIKPLLKDNDTFMFSAEPETLKIQEKKNWDAYRMDPYNPYMHGLMESMENEVTNLTRRNDILDQLLAYHGEQPMIFDILINGSKYSGNKLQDLVIFKSLYLQNLGLLSYYRMKAYNFLGANKIAEIIPFVSGDFEQHFPGYHKDFIFNSGLIDEMEKITEQDCINFSAPELKLGLFFGLKPLYRDYILGILDENEKGKKKSEKEKKDNIEKMMLAWWMIRQRRGLIFLETGLLMQALWHRPLPLSQQPGKLISGNNVILLFPDFIPMFKSASFKKRLEAFLKNTLPVSVTYTPCFVNCQLLKKIIPVFTKWHNALLFREKKRLPGREVAEITEQLVRLLNEIILPGNE